MRLGVVGAGTIGVGIARVAGARGVATLLHDVAPTALERALARLPESAAAHVERAGARSQLAGCDVVVEALPEDLEAKRVLFGQLAGVVAGDCVLATTTSSLSVTAIARGLPHPERIVGMHFFDPPHRMRLVEVVAADASGEAALARANELAQALGCRPIRAADLPGFLVARCHRPFGLEALKLLEERVADVETIDRVARLAGGFPMGPFELQDVVGIDVAFDTAKSVHEQSFGEPRWRPSPLSAQMVAAGRLGRKNGRGWYAYPAHAPAPAHAHAHAHAHAEAQAPAPPDEHPAPEAATPGLVVIAGELALAHELRLLADDAGWDVRVPEDVGGEVPDLILDCGAQPEDQPLQGGPQALLLADGSLAQLDPGGTSVGFHALPPLRVGGLVELTRARDSNAHTAASAERFFASCGLHTAWVGDAPGLVLGRLVAQLVNEAAFAVAAGVGSPPDVDAGMVLGFDHPRGPLAWGDAIGLEHVLALLDALHDELREERYRAAPLLRRLVAEGRTGVLAGEGFFVHD